MLKVGWGVAQKCLARWPEALGHTPSTKGDERKAGVGVTECIHGFSHTSGVWETEPRALLQVSTLLLSSILSGNNSWIMYRSKMNRFLLYLRILVRQCQREEARLRKVNIVDSWVERNH